MRFVIRPKPLCRLSALALFLSGLGCEGRTAPEITVVVGRGGPQHVTFEPERQFAEYIELAGDRREIRITLAEHRETSCEHFVPPGPEEAVVIVTIVTPPKEPPRPGRYPWSGRIPSEAPVKQPVAIPKVLIGNESFVLPPGGGVELTALSLEPDGEIAGLLDFRFPGDASHGATQIAGRFSARLCHFAPAPVK